MALLRCSPPFQEHQCVGIWAALERTSMVIWSKEAFSSTQLSKAKLKSPTGRASICVVVVSADTAATGCSSALEQAEHMLHCQQVVTWRWPADLMLNWSHQMILCCWEQRQWVGLGFMGERLGSSGLWIEAGLDSSALEQEELIL